MSKIRSFAVLVCVLSVANAWGVPFKDDFNRPNGAVANGWATQTDGTITVEIVDNEVLIAGTQATDWVRCGISRPITGETKVSCDFKADNSFNFHLRVDAAASSAYVEIYAWPGGPFSHASSPAGGWPGWVAIPNSNMVAGQYNNVALEQKGTDFIFTLNGTVVGTIANESFTTIESVLISSDAAADTTGSLHIDNVQIGVVVAGKAKDPSPADSATDVPRDVVLGWVGGEYANTHNVYLGPTFEDVNAASLAQAVSKGQTGTTYKVAELLEFGKTYYWRVDEVNAPPSSAVFKGDVWSFTVEPYTYPITGVTATASSSDKTTTGPANTVNGSGLTNDLHSTVTDAMWLSSMTGAQPTWIQYAFDKVYKLDELWVWNYNAEFEPVLGYGLKDVTIEYSTDGTTWTVLKDVQFAQATAQAGYAHNTVVNLDGAMARYIRLTANSNWSAPGLQQYGLSEVRFFHLPVEARSPQPGNYADNVSLDATLDWRPGREATSHTVSYGTDKAAVAGGTATTKTVTDHGLDAGPFDFGTTYYWKVDEVGDVTYPGSVWNFTTQQYAAVEDFESYTDEDGNRIYQAWIDGWTNGTGSTVGYLQAPFAERVIVNSGNQSMPFEYNNVKTPFYSEAERTFDTPMDWTGNGANTLSLWVRGNPAKFVETAPGQYKISSNSGDIWGNSDNFRFVYKTLNGDGSISAKVIALTNTTSNWAKAGVMIRNTLDAGSTYAFMFPTPDRRRAFQNRPTAGGNAVSAHSSTNAITYPFWVKVERKGNQLTAYYSADGKTWTIQPDTENTGADRSPNPQTIAMSNSVCIGLAVTSNNAAAAPCLAEFSDVVTTGSVTGQWIVADVGPNSANDPAGMYVVVEDTAGKKKTVTHPDPAATTVTAWTQWRIPFSDITGVNLAAVKKLTLGVGDRANPKPGAAGMLYVDDVLFGRPRTAADIANLIANGGFETGDLAPWGAWGGGGATVTTAVVQDCTGADVPEGPIEGQYCLNVTVSGASTNWWDCAFNITPPTFAKGARFTLSAFFKCKSGTGRVNMKPEHAATPWEGYGDRQFTITDRWVEYYVTTPVFTSDVSPTSLTFHIGFQAQEFWVDDVKFYPGEYVPSASK